LIGFLEFLETQPLLNNDYFKYVNSYKKGKELNPKYFRHDSKKLREYYAKSDKDPQYNPFGQSQYERYVLFMMLKFSDCYLSEYDGMFGVKIKESREYNPLTSIPSVLRSLLPFRIKEYDIVQAYPTFIFLELGIEPFDVYSCLEKRKFNILLNTHKGVKDATLEAVRAKLKPIYGERVEEVMTEGRFNERGRLFEDLARHEKQYIQKFVDANKPKKYVRLHDGVVTLEDTECDVLEFGIV